MSKATAKKPGAAAPTVATEVLNLPLSAVFPAPENPRKHFRQESLDELAASIVEHGVLEPILVRELSTGGTYEILAGERRHRAALLAKLDVIPAIVRYDGDGAAEVLRIVENLQREDLTACETADAYRRLIDAHAMTAEAIAAKVGVTERSIEQQLSLTRLGLAARALVDGGTVDKTVAVRAGSIPDAKLQVEFLKYVAERKLSFKDAEAHLGRYYQRSLAKAGFEPKSEDLLPAVGPCTACPKNTSNMAADAVTGKKPSPNVCTDLVCWKAKTAAVWKRLEADAPALGGRRLTDAENKKAFPPPHPNNANPDYVYSPHDAPFVPVELETYELKGKPLSKFLDGRDDYAKHLRFGLDQSGQVRRLVDSKYARKVINESKATAEADERSRAAKKRAADPSAVSSDTLRKREQTDARKAAHEAWHELEARFEPGAVAHPAPRSVLALLVQWIGRARASNADHRAALTEFVDLTDAERKTIALNTWAPGGKKAQELFEQVLYDRVAELDEPTLMKILVGWVVRDTNKGVEDLGYYGGSEKKGPWFRMNPVAAAAYGLYGVELGAKFTRIRGERASAEDEQREKAKAKKGAAKATGAKKAAKTTRRDPDETPAGRKAKRLAKEIAKLDEYDGIDPPALDDVETIEVEMADEFEAPAIVAGVEDLLGRDVEHQIVDPAAAEVPFSRECRDPEPEMRWTHDAATQFWRLHDEGFFDPHPAELAAAAAALPPGVDEQELIDEAGEALERIEREFIIALQRSELDSVMVALKNNDPIWAAALDSSIAVIRRERAKIDAAYARKLDDEGAEDSELQAAALEPHDDPLAGCGPCRVCGCTADDPCPEGCERQETTLCTACAGLSPRELHEFAARRTKLADLEVGSKQRFNKGRDLDRDIANAKTQRAMARTT